MTAVAGSRSMIGGLVLLLAAALVLALLPTAGNAAVEDIRGEVIHSPADPDAELVASLRFAGQQRFATAALIALETWESNPDVIIARHDDWPDALAGGYLAGVQLAPVLLVRRDRLEPDTLTALEELGASDITLLGGTAAISAETENALADLGYDVTRIGGANRYETARMVAMEGGVVGEINGRRTAFVATGLEFADALTAGPLAYAGEHPVLLTPPDRLHPATAAALADLDIERVLLLGGTAAVSAVVEAEIRTAIGGGSVRRLSGPTRVETAVEVAEFALDGFLFDIGVYAWARGNDFADALTIGPRLGELGGPLLLVPTPNLADSRHGTNLRFASERACLTSSIEIAGGRAALSEAVETELRAAFACPGEPGALELEAVPDSVEQGGAIQVTATVTDNVGNRIAGVEVFFEALSDAAEPEFADQTLQTDANGQAVTTVTSATPGVAWLEGFFFRDDFFASDLVPVEWTIPGQTSTLFAFLWSDEEVGTGAETLDPPVTGTAWVFLNSDDGEMCWAVRMDETDHDIGSYEQWMPSMPNAHIHEGAFGEPAGAIVVALGQVQDDTLASIGCASVPAATLDAIEADPEAHNANVHTTAYPGGVARGQLWDFWAFE